MTSVLHFAEDEDQRAACGVRVFLCSEYTNELRYVDCARCRKTKRFGKYDPTRYDVDVWNHEGDVVRGLWRIPADDVDRIRKEYEDDPTLVVVVKECAL